MNTYKKKVVKDCAVTIFSSTIFNILDTVMGASLTVYISNTLAKFADAIFAMDMSYGIKHFGILIICVLVSLFILPLLGTIKEFILFDNSLRHDRMIYGRYLNKKFNEAQKFSEGEVQYRLEQDAIDLRCMWLDLLTKCISVPIVLGYLLYHSIKISLPYTGVIFLVSTLKFITPIVTKKMNARYDSEVRDYQTQVRSYEFELLDQPHKVKMYGLMLPLLYRFDQIYLRFFNDTLRKSIRFTSVISNLYRMIDALCSVLILLSGAVLIINRAMTVGGLVATFGFISVFNTLFENISSLIRDFPVFKTLVERLTVFYTGAEDVSGIQVSSFNKITADFSYSYGSKAVIQHVDFSIHQGDKVAICGKNGSGKSTLLKVLSGLLKDYSGHVTIDEQELSEISSNSWYDCIAYVEQDPVLFPMSIRENIHIGNLKASDQELDEVIRTLEIQYLVDRDKCKENTELSGGEKQKVSIARALLKNTPIIMMDEPNNNLDKDSLAWLGNFIIHSPKTIIFVSHDEKIISCANCVIFL